MRCHGGNCLNPAIPKERSIGNLLPRSNDKGHKVGRALETAKGGVRAGCAVDCQGFRHS